MSKRFTLNWTIKSDDSGKSVKQFLAEQKISKTALTAIKFRDGEILSDEKSINVRHILREGELLTVIFPKEEVSTSLVVEHFPLDIIYEDDSVLVINKPAYMNTIPSREHPTGSLANGLMGYYENSEIKSSPHIVTRLDRNTSGLVLIAKNRYIHHILSLKQRDGLLHREYEAIVSGNLKENNGTIVKPIGRKENSIIERVVTEEGQYACTHFEVMKRYEDFTHIKLQLETGRTHQIRVHMAYLGHPLLGDDLYGGKLHLIKRQALHCKTIQFQHPITGERLTFESELPLDMKAVFR